MAYNPYGGVPGYGPPPGYGTYPGASHAPGMAHPPGMAQAPTFGPPPGMSSAPGMAPPPGVQPLSASTQANRPSGVPAFQPPPNLPNINFNAPVIRLGSTAPQMRSNASMSGDRRDSHAPTTGNRPGLGLDRNLEQSRAQLRESMQALVPPTSEECLRTIGLKKIPNGVGGDEGVQKLLHTVGRLRRWDSAQSHLTNGKGALFGFAQYEDPESLSTAIDLLGEIQVPVTKQSPRDPPKAEEGADPFEGIEKVKLCIAVDPNTTRYLESWKASQGQDPAVAARLAETREALNKFVRALFYPPTQSAKDSDGDTPMGDGVNGTGENVEVINIPIAQQEDELADIPADMRETVAKEIAAFRERSNQRDLERLKQEEEYEERERRRNGAPRVSRLGSPPPANSNMIPLGPRGILNAPSGPRGNRGVEFVNGGTTNTNSYNFKDEDDTDASDNELHERELAKRRAEEDKMFVEAEKKWLSREKMKGDALKREETAMRREKEEAVRRRIEQLEKEKNWDDERESLQKKHLYYRDHGQWIKQRAAERGEEARNDEKDRQDEREKAAHAHHKDADLESVRSQVDSFLDKQGQEIMQKRAATSAPAAPQKVTISFGAAAQRAQARAAPVRTMADIEGLLDDQEEEQTTKRQLIPIKFEPITDTKAMTQEDIENAVKALAQEIPVDKESLWAWNVKWDYLEDSVIREKLRPFIEKKVVEFLGVQEQFLVDIVSEHIQKHGKPGDLVDTLREALDEDAEDMVKKLWRMVIFFTESEKRGLPA